MRNREAVRVALLGAGERGQLMFGLFAKKHPRLFKYVAVAEPNDERRNRFGRDFDIPAENVFADWRELLAKPQLADAVINAMPDVHHYPSTIAALRKGYHVLLEKPMAQTPAQCVRLIREAKEQDRILQIFLECRYLELYSTMKRLVDDGDIGRVMAIQTTENLGYWHFIMSYVRGFARRSADVVSFLSAKGIHDFDLITWIAGARPRRVSSFGELTYFKEENAPPGAPAHCLDGCPVESTCPYHAYKQYIRPGFPQIPVSLLGGIPLAAFVDGYVKYPRLRSLSAYNLTSIDEEGRIRELTKGPHGRCVFHCDNDVVDHQVVNIEYEGGTLATLALNAMSVTWERTMNINGSTGEIYSKDFSGRLEVRNFSPKNEVKRRRVPFNPLFHGGSDGIVLVEFAKSVQNAHETKKVLTAASDALYGHLLCFAAEEARKGNTVVDMMDFRRRAEEDADSLVLG
jgi:predicted dehydrogenase